ncbi:MAG: DUF4007 family protein [Parasphingorhabdus sp.]|uniref:DUF4007 family protein n=1 Tax=Parasphingorhabdus sp. TaxID=2709688 RepID=UPI0030030F6B
MATIFDNWPGTGQFAGHETFPLRLLWLKKAHDFTVDGVPISAFKDEKAIIRFGVGKNMAASMRYWATAAGIIDVDDKLLKPTEFGSLLLSNEGYDPFLENISSLWLIHWNLASTPDLTTTTYFAFNSLLGNEFRAQDIVEALTDTAAQHEWRAAPKTLVNDANVFLRNYSARDASGSEDAGEPLLAELNLIRHTQPGGWYQFSVGPKPTLDDDVLVLALDEFWGRSNKNSSVMTAEQMSYSPGAPGRVFKLDEDSLVRRLTEIEALTDGAYIWVDTAGLRQIQKQNQLDRKRVLERIYSAPNSQMNAA